MTEAVGEIKRTISLNEPRNSYQGVSEDMSTTPVEAIALTEDILMGGTTPKHQPSKLNQPSSEAMWSLLPF